MGGCLKLVGGVAALFLAVILIAPAFIAPGWSVEASAQIDAPPSVVFPLVSKLKNWEEWAAWANKAGADYSFAFEGPEQGPGAVMKSEGAASNLVVTVLEVDPDKSMVCELDVADGQGTGRISFHLTAVDGGTHLTIEDEGQFEVSGLVGYFMRIRGLLMGYALQELSDANALNIKQLAEQRAG